MAAKSESIGSSWNTWISRRSRAPRIAGDFMQITLQYSTFLQKHIYIYISLDLSSCILLYLVPPSTLCLCLSYYNSAVFYFQTKTVKNTVEVKKNYFHFLPQGELGPKGSRGEIGEPGKLVRYRELLYVECSYIAITARQSAYW